MRFSFIHRFDYIPFAAKTQPDCRFLVFALQSVKINVTMFSIFIGALQDRCFTIPCQSKKKKGRRLMSQPMAQSPVFTEDDYYQLPENIRSELIDGQFYNMSAPSRIHQKILSSLHATIYNYIQSKKALVKSSLFRSPSSCLRITKPSWNRI